MARKKPATDRLPIAKCKRIIRPLLSKIHALTDVYVKYPSKVEFDTQTFTSSKVSGGILKFTHPPTSSDRLVALKPFISSELFQAYSEIFSIFRNVIGSVCGPPKQPFPTLSALSAYKMGKSMTLGTKTTYYRLNQTLLFEPDTIPKYLQKYHHELADDIDDWLLMEPSSVTDSYRIDFLLGYVIHILVFNLRNLLYLLVPVLVHWLKEQNMAQLLRVLFSEYWLFLPRDPDRKAIDELALDLVDFPHDPSFGIFWLFYKIGYWEHLVSELNIGSRYSERFGNFDCVFLDVLAQTDRLVLTREVDLQDIYAVLVRNSQHPHNTTILVSIIAQSIFNLKKELKSASTSHATLELLRGAHSSLRMFLQTWLSLNESCVFNSLDKGNDDIFQALSRLVKFILGKCTRIISYLNECGLSAKVKDMLSRFKNLYYNMDMMKLACQILEAYFLDTNTQLSLEGLRPNSVASCFSDLLKNNNQHKEVGRFLVWLYDRHNSDMHKLAQSCFKEFFGDWHEGLEDVHFILFGA